MAIADPRVPDRSAYTGDRHAAADSRSANGDELSLTMPRLAPGRYLAIEDGDEVVLLPLAADLMHIGRSPAADIVLDDASVSRRHALVARRGERTVILDDRSLNGVHVNGVRVSEAELHDGDAVARRARDAALRRTGVEHAQLRFEPPAGRGVSDRPVQIVPRLRARCRAPDHTRVVFLSLLLAGMAFALSQTVVSPALPEIQREFGADASSAAWILTGYLLAASVATPIVGKLGDLFGRGKVLTMVLLVFAAGSAVCALAPSLGVLVAGRVIQGVGGGIFPLAFGIIRETFPPERVATAIGGISATFGIGGGVGLVIAGLIVEALGASWLFWLGLMALPAAFAIWRYVPQRGDAAGRARRLARRRAALRRAREPAVRAEQGQRVGLGLAAACIGLVVGGLALAPSGAGWRPGSTSRSWTCACCAGAPC